MLACDKTLSLVQRTAGKDDDTYTVILLSGCSWYSKDVTDIRDDGRIFSARATKIRIPSLPEGVILKKGDFLVNGTIAGPVTKPSDLSGAEYVTALSIGNNRRGKFPHWEVTAE